MKLIQFEFICSRPVPFYAALCNHFLATEHLEISISGKNNRYLIEAVGKQAEIEQLAERISQSFMVSVWLLESHIREVPHREGTNLPLKNIHHQLPFCLHCQPRFGDNQSAEFGDWQLACPICHGEDQLEQGLAIELELVCQDLLEKRSSTFSYQNHTLTLSLDELPPALTANPTRSQVLICNPNTLPQHFIVPEQHVLALSSLEKPRVTVRPNPNQTTLTRALYDIVFGYDRILAIVTERLRLLGVGYVHYHAECYQPLVTWLNEGWSEVQANPNAFSITPVRAVEPLHEDGCFSHIKAFWHKGRIHFNHQPVENTVSHEHIATCALLAGGIDHSDSRNSAVIYFGEAGFDEIVTEDKFTRTETFLRQQPMSTFGYDLIAQLEQADQKTILDKFKQQYPEQYQALHQLNLAGFEQKLSGIFAIAATVLGLDGQNVSELNDRLQAQAMSYPNYRGEQIDFDIDPDAEGRSIDWKKMVGSLMSYRLITEEHDIPQLAFGIYDSLADKLSNWIEHLDQQVGVKSVVLAGKGFTNEVFAWRTALRIGKNYPININRKLDLEGANISAGSLYLKVRRK
ncbi:hypothetical protein A0J47_009650 [Photobacterium damselae subsp. damselae]|uniref:hypothetical protein n=1 Tax=Photobacterium damselae TaxID=38293 RepID=UPI00083A32A6|nr:hypothetical protein [Photobacterium damselae]QSH56219.1 hypothetical protein A0J47_009650 [Photobacterium damselae subsp. damselae]